MNRTGWEFGFQAMQGIGTLIVTALAVWGVFFTDLPTTIIRQLQSEVADTKEDVVLLKREKQSLLEEIETAKVAIDQAEHRRADAASSLAKTKEELEELRVSQNKVQQEVADLVAERDAVTKERDTASTDLAALRAQIDSIKKQLAKTATERDRYLGTVFGKAVQQLIDGLKLKQQALTLKFGEVEYLQNIPIYLEREKDRKRMLQGVTDRQQKFKIIDQWRDKYKDDKDVWWTMWGLGDTSEAELLHQRIRVMEQSRTRTGNGAEFLAELLQREKFDYLLDRDWKVFSSAVAAIADSHDDMLSDSLGAILQGDFNDQELADEVSRTGSALKNFGSFIELLPDELSKKLPRG